MSNTFTRDPQPRIRYAGDGARTSFDLPFPILAGDDLLAFVDDQPATGFAIAGLGEPTGKITFLEPPAAGTTITLLRRTEGIRETEFVDGGPFRAATINAELDRIMMLIQENREEHNRALRARAFEGDLDLCLPPVAQRANNLLGFDSSGQPMVFGQSELPISGDASGQLVTPAGATTARALGEHLAAVVNVRDFGAIGDGVSDDSAAFQAAIVAAQARSGVAYVPASPNAYVIGAALVLDGVGLVGDGPGSMLKLALASGFALQLTGDAPRARGPPTARPRRQCLAAERRGGGSWPGGPGWRSDRRWRPRCDAAARRGRGLPYGSGDRRSGSGDRRLRVRVLRQRLRGTVRCSRLDPSRAHAIPCVQPRHSRRSGRAVRSGDVGRRRGYRFAAGQSIWSHRVVASVWSRSPICSCPAISTSMSESGRATPWRCAAAASMLPASGAASGSSCSRPARRSWRLL